MSFHGSTPFLQKLSHQPLLTIRHDTDIPGEPVQNGAVLHRPHNRFLTIVRIFIPDRETELVTIPEIQEYAKELLRRSTQQCLEAFPEST